MLGAICLMLLCDIVTETKDFKGIKTQNCMLQSHGIKHNAYEIECSFLL